MNDPLNPQEGDVFRLPTSMHWYGVMAVGETTAEVEFQGKFYTWLLSDIAKHEAVFKTITPTEARRLGQKYLAKQTKESL